MKEKIQAAIAKKLLRWQNDLIAKRLAARHAKFKTQPNNFVMDEPSRLINPQCMEIGDDVYLGPNSMLNCIVQTPASVMSAPPGTPVKHYDPVIRLGNRVSATGGLQLAACLDITIEDDVLFATNINLTDALHEFSNIDVPYKFQGLWQAAPIKVKRGSWIGQNVVITPGVTVGEMCIVGANSVVNHDIPDYSIAVGTPARVIKKWDPQSNDWVKV